MEDLQSILEKINHEGVERAEAEAKCIIDAAKKKADAIVSDAHAKAAEEKAEAEKASAAYAERANATITQASRDLILKTENAITAMLEKLLTKNVGDALANEQTAADIVTESIKALTGPGEINCGEKLAQALASQLQKLGNFKVVTDNFNGTGFTVKIDGGRVEHSYTSEVIAAELARYVRPDLAKLLK